MFIQMTFDDLFVNEKSCLNCEHEPKWVEQNKSLWGICRSYGPTFVGEKYDPKNLPLINKINAKYGKTCKSWSNKK